MSDKKRKNGFFGVLATITVLMCPLAYIVASIGHKGQAGFNVVAITGIVLLIFSWAGRNAWEWFSSRHIPQDDEWEAIEPFEVTHYQSYLQSEEWQQRRQFMLRRAGYRCQLCNKKGLLKIHHRTYDHVGHERIDDLVVLCDACHSLFHTAGQMPA